MHEMLCSVWQLRWEKIRLNINNNLKKKKKLTKGENKNQIKVGHF